MQNAAMMAGDYVDARFVKSRKVAQIVIEIPLEKAGAFFAAFGTPNPAEGVPVALARLNQTVTNQNAYLDPAPKEKRKWSDLMPSQQAALRCNEPGFWKFLDVRNADEAANVVRTTCGVKSRSELDANQEAVSWWHKLDNEYHNWQRGY